VLVACAEGGLRDARQRLLERSEVDARGDFAAPARSSICGRRARMRSSAQASGSPSATGSSWIISFVRARHDT
jgi:hypothetical protein